MLLGILKNEKGHLSIGLKIKAAQNIRNMTINGLALPNGTKEVNDMYSSLFAHDIPTLPKQDSECPLDYTYSMDDEPSGVL